MDLGIKGKKALVLGSSSGIGKGIAQALAQEGVEVVLASRSLEHLRKTQDEIKASHIVEIDLRDKNSGIEVIEKTTKLCGEIDILVGNTGGPTKGYFLDIADEDWETQYQNVVLSTIQATRTVIPSMQNKQWGRILLVTSIAAKEPVAKLTVSNVLRAGLLGLVNSVSKEIAPMGITFNSILPGYTKTERLKELGVDLSDIADSIPAKRLGTPEELGNVAAFLCSQQASYLTGQAILYDGGLSASI